MKVVKITEEKGWTKLPDGSVPNKKTILFEVANTNDQSNPNFPYSFWSGGTQFPLMTINESVNSQFEIDKEYNIDISIAE